MVFKEPFNFNILMLSTGVKLRGDLTCKNISVQCLAHKNRGGEMGNPAKTWLK